MADHLGFVISQVSHIEQEVYKTRYPGIQYHDLVPVVTEAHPWARTVTHFSRDFRGDTKPMAGRAQDFPIVTATHEKHELTVEMEGIAYEYSMEEVEQARMLKMNLASEGAADCRFLVEKALDRYLLTGNVKYGWQSLINAPATQDGNPFVRRTDAAATGTGNSRHWFDKSAEDIIAELNDLLLSVYTNSDTVEMADTLLMPPTVWGSLISKFIDGTSTSVFDKIKENNVYTMKTGRPLMIRECRGLEDAAAGSTGRVVAYWRNKMALKYHLPMPFKFLRTEYSRMCYFTPGIFRHAGLDIRLPASMAYLDQISA